MAGRIQFSDRKPEPVSWWARFTVWVRGRWQSVAAVLSREPKKTPPTAVPQPPRIRFREPDPRPLVIRDAPTHCPACGLLLSVSDTVVCTLNSAHMVHAQCSVDLLKGKCPLDGAALRAVG
jgi:hypothetical protein